jgi:hypothetical protein
MPALLIKVGSQRFRLVPGQFLVATLVNKIVEFLV